MTKKLCQLIFVLFFVPLFLKATTGNNNIVKIKTVVEIQQYFAGAFVDESVKNFPAIVETNPAVLQFVSHGRPGELLLNGKWLNDTAIAAFIQSGPFINKDTKHINIYGCEFAKGNKGEEAVRYLENALHVTIAASTNITGKGGDWKLEIGSAINGLNFPQYQFSLQCAGVAGGKNPGDDFDGDGVCNVNDIDLDNDGVLNATEAPNCYYTVSQASDIVAISSSSSITFTSATNGIIKAIDSNFATNAVLTAGQAIAGKTLFQFKFAAPLQITQLKDSLTSTTGIVSSGATYRIEATNDTLGTWTDVSGTLTAPVTPGAGNSMVWNLTPGQAYSYYRIVGISGTTAAGGSKEFYPTAVSNYSPSLNPKSTCTADLDGDGILNQYDLDSDGDGCPDAMESGAGTTGSLGSGNVINGTPNTTTATANAIVNGPYNSYGLAISVQTNATASTSTNYTSTYNNYAMMSNINTCADTDGDGVPDISDLDADNDGILNTTECPVSTLSFTPNAASGSGQGYTYTVTPSVGAGSIDANGNFVINSGNNTEIHIVFTKPAIVSIQTGNQGGVNNGTLGGSTSDLLNLVTNSNAVGWSKSDPALQINDYGLSNTSPTFAQGGLGTNNYTFGLGSSSGTATSQAAGFTPANNSVWQWKVMNYNVTDLTISNAGNGANAGYDITAQMPCFIDTDGDGISNQYDLDSDGDGCPDAAETGITGTLQSGTLVNSNGSFVSPNAVAKGPYGANGFANPLETSSESGVYTGSYANYNTKALVSSVHSCPCFITTTNPASGSCAGNNNLTFSLKVLGTGNAATYTVSGATPATGTYGTTTVFTIAGGADGNNKTVIITDASTGGCTDTIVVLGASACAPIASNDISSYIPGVSKIINVLSNDTTGSVVKPATVQLVGAGGSPVSSLTVPGQGTWTANPDGTITFAPLVGFNGVPTPIKYTVKDASGNSSNQATVSLTVAPIATNDKSPYTPGIPVTVHVLTNDTTGTLVNPTTVKIVGTTNPGDPLVVPGQGTWTVNTVTGDITFTPLPTFKGVPTPISYTVKDAAGNESTPPATVTLYQLPVAINDTSLYIPGMPVTVNILANDTTGAIINPITVKIAGTANAGDSLLVSGQGVWKVNLTTGSLTFTPLPGFTGTPSPINYSGKSDSGYVSNLASVTLIKAPVTTNDTSLYTPGVAVTIPVLTNDTTGAAIVPSTVKIAGTTNPGDPLTVPGQGTWSVNTSTGAITFTPQPGFTGKPTPISYSGKDASGNPSNSASVTLIKAPVTTNDTSLYTPGVAVTIPVLTNDTTGAPIIPSTVKIAGTTNPGDPLTVPGQGIWSVNTSTGAITFTPQPGFTGTPTPINYSGKDASGNPSNSASVTLIKAPVTTNDTSLYTPGVAVTIPVLTNDTTGAAIVPSTVKIGGTSNPGDPLTVPGEGVWSVNTSTGAITFTPQPGFTGTPTPISYSGKDASGNPSNSASVTLIKVPVATNDTGLYTPGVAVTIPVLTNDTTGAAIVPSTVKIVGTANPGDPLTVPGQGAWSVNTSTGAITFTPQPGFTGTPTPINYSGKDAGGNPSNSASVTLIKAPVTTNDTSLFTPGMPVTIAVLSNDTTGAAIIPSTVQITGTTNPGDPLVVAGEGTWTVNPATGVITFTPVFGFNGTPTPITYRGKDAAGNISNASSVILIEVPVATNDVSFYLPGVPKIINILANDTTGFAVDPSTVQIIGTSGPVSSLTVSGQGTWIVNPDGTITFTPLVGFMGIPSPINYTVKGTNSIVSNQASVSLTIAPIATNDVGVYVPGTPVTVPVLTNDTTGSLVDPTTVKIVGTTNPGDPLIVPGQGTWTVNTITGDITFTPDPGFKGVPTPINYTVKDIGGHESTPPASVTLYQLPVASNDTSLYVPGIPVTVNIVANDTTGAPINPATIKINGSSNIGDPFTVAGEGTWTVNLITGAVTFTPQLGFTGTPTPISYSGQDTAGHTSNLANVTLIKAPVTTNDTSLYTPGVAVTIPVLLNDTTGAVIVPATVKIGGTTNPGDPLTVPGEGVWSVNTSTGAITFTPQSGFTGTPTPINYSGKDTGGNPSNSASVILVKVPLATNDTSLYTPGIAVTIPVLLNDTTGAPIVPSTVKIAGTTNAGDPLTVAGEGTWSVNTSTGAITFTPQPGFTGTPTPINYSGKDVSGNPSNVASVTLIKSPVAIDDTSFYTTGIAVTIPILSNDTTGSAIIPATVQIVGTSNPGDALIVVNEGVWTINSGTGAVTFTPQPGFIGTPTSIKYTGKDAAGNVSNQANVILVKKPIATDDVSNYPPGTIITLDVTANDTDGAQVDPTTVQIVGTSNPGDPFVVAGQGTWSVDPGTGAITFTPQPGFMAVPTYIEYTVKDVNNNVSNQAKVILTAPLPLTIVSFTGKAQIDNTNMLTWVVAKVENIFSYTISKSSDQSSWKPLGTLIAQNISGRQTISLIDAVPNATEYYRLSTTDKNGIVTYFTKVVNLKQNHAKDLVEVYPNPARDYINLKYTSLLAAEHFRVTIVDVLGRKLKTLETKINAGENIIHIDLNGLANATYFIQYHNVENGMQGNVKFVKGK